jgi:molecular chaperone IbpA
MFLGFEDAFEMLDTFTSKSEYPPYNIERVSDDEYVLEMAIAGFKKGDINISVEKNILKVQGASDKKDANYVHKGLATRKFQKAFHLAEHMEVGSAKSEDGILKINLVRNIPEEEKPKIIEIG